MKEQYTRSNLTLFVEFRKALDDECYMDCARYQKEIKARLQAGILTQQEVDFWFTRQDGRFDDSSLNSVFSY